MNKIVKLPWSVLFVSLVLAFLACSDDSSSNTGLPEDESAESMGNDKNVDENGGKDAGTKDGGGTGVNGGKDAGSKDGGGTGVNGGKDAGSKDGGGTGVNDNEDAGSKDGEETGVNDDEGDKDESGDATGVCGTETYDLETQRCAEGDVVETACGSGESAVWYVADGSKVCESGVVKGVCGTETYDLGTQRCAEGDVVETACGSGENTVWYDSSKYFCDTRDKQLYGYVRIANSQKAQVWMTKNLNYKTNSGSWCYSNSGSNCTKYGRLYTWSAATSACHPGWRLPSTSDWETLFEIVGGKTYAAKKLKSKSWNGTDNYGFSALPGGSYDGTRFNNAGSYAYFWASTADNDRSAQSIDMSSYDSPTKNGYVKSMGFSVRCLKK